jgi:flagellar FliL protein
VAKKAKIDILDIHINKENRTPFGDETADDSVLDSLADGMGDDKKHRWISRLGAGRSKILLILIVTILFVAIAGGAIWLYKGKGNKESVPTQEDARKKVIPAGERVAVFDHFVVDVRDKKGDIRVAFCDIAVELEHPRATGNTGEQVELRNVIYSVLKRKPIVEGLSPEGRDLIKIELKNELNRLLGEKTVKNIYITRFEVI